MGLHWNLWVKKNEYPISNKEYPTDEGKEPFNKVHRLSIKDKITIVKPFIALKESISLYPGAVCIQDFDFSTLRSFPVQGLNSIEAVQTFQEVWSYYKLQTQIKLQIEEKEKNFYCIGAWPHKKWSIEKVNAHLSS